MYISSGNLHKEAEFGNIEGCRLLLEHGALLDAQGENGKTPLHLVAETGSEALCRFLVAVGASVTLADNEGMTPLGIIDPDLRVVLERQVLEKLSINSVPEPVSPEMEPADSTESILSL